MGIKSINHNWKNDVAKVMTRKNYRTKNGNIQLEKIKLRKQ
jgi:hypothetical protein